MCNYIWVYIYAIKVYVYTHDSISVRYRNTAGFINRCIQNDQEMLCIYTSFLIQRHGLRLREEAMVLCFTEIELCFRDIYEEKKEKEVLLHVWFILTVTF